jgi:hypothetical protein
MLEVTAAQYIDGYRIKIQFNDGAEGVVDLGDALWGPVFEPLKDFEAFRRFAVRFHTLSWDNGADFAPEFLRDRLVENVHAGDVSHIIPGAG